MFAATWPHVFVMLIVVLRLRPGFRQLRTLYPLCLSLTPVMPWMLSLQPPPGARLPRLLLVCPVPLPSIRVPCCSMLVLLPLVLVCPSECSSVCSSFRSPCVRRPSAVSPLFYYTSWDLLRHRALMTSQFIVSLPSVNKTDPE